MVESIIVCVIAAGVVGLAVRSLYGTLTGKDHSCGCGSQCMSPNTCHHSSQDAAPDRDLLQIDAEPQEV